MKALKEFGSWIGAFSMAFVLSLVIGIFVFQPFKVEGHSMEPTLQNDQRIYVSKLSHTFSYLPEYGDIVVIDSRVNRERTLTDSILENPMVQYFRGNMDEHVFYVKRVIGKPGDVLEFKENQVYRNGEALQEPYMKEAMIFSSNRKWTVPDKHVFVMGDNRNNSSDSRNIGYIPLDHVMGIMKFP